MQIIPEISCFTIVGNDAVFAIRNTVHGLNRSVSFEKNAFNLIQTSDFVVAFTGDKNESYAINKKNLIDSTFDWIKLPRFVSPFSHNYKHNEVVLYSGIFRDEKSWVFRLDDYAEIEYPARVFFVPGEDLVFTYENPMPFSKGLSGERKVELQLPDKKKPVKIPEVLGLSCNKIWLRNGESEILGYDLENGSLTTSFDVIEIIKLKNFDINFAGFGGDKNYYNFHIYPVKQSIIAFANRYYCEINLSDLSTKIVDLDDLPGRIRITKSRLCAERNWLFFVGRAPGDVFDQHFGIFDTVSQKVIDLEKAKDKDEFFGHPPFFGTDKYGVLSTKKVLYLKILN